MSTSVFPSLVGLGYDVVRTPIWKTTVQENLSGKEVRVALMTYPRYQWDLTFNRLSSTAALAEFQNLIGFYNSRQGSFDSFLYTDADDNSVTTQAIGVGDGTTLTFQLVKAFGGYVEPVFAPNTVSHVYVNGVDQAGHWTVSNWGTSPPGLITFASGHAPTTGLSVTATFTYYYPVRFVDDKIAFNLFNFQNYKLKKVSLMSVKN